MQSLEGSVYCLYDEKNGICRIGKTASSTFNNRMASQQAYYPFPLKVIRYYFKNKTFAETHLHRVFRDKKLNGDWYTITPTDFNRAVKKYKETIKDKPIIDYKNENWFMKVGLKKAMVKLLEEKGDGIVICEFEGKKFKVKFKTYHTYEVAKSGVSQSVEVYSMNESQYKRGRMYYINS